MEIRKNRLIEFGWLDKSKPVLFERFIYNQINFDNSPAINEKNTIYRNKFLNQFLNSNLESRKLGCCISSENDDILVSEIDRYGLPLRTVLNKKTGLMRTDPYYSMEWLNDFYSLYYRDLYTSNYVSYPSFLADQIKTGESIFDFVKQYLPEKSEVCEIGCGMGGILLPFKLNGHNITGVDLGVEYIEIGKNIDLNLSVGDIDLLIKDGKKFDLIIVNHVLEHIPEIKEFLYKTKEILNEMGLIYIAVPGILSIPYNYNFNSLMFLQNAHCWHFTRNTLSVLLNQVGYEILNIKGEISCVAINSKNVIDLIDLANEYDFVLNNLNQYELTFETNQKQGKLQITQNKSYNIFFKLFRKGLRILIKLFNKMFNSQYNLK